MTRRPRSLPQLAPCSRARTPERAWHSPVLARLPEALPRLGADISQFQRSMATAGASAKGFAKDLEQADSRMANLVQTGLALAPAVVPIGAAAVPAIAGLTLQLGLAAGAGATALLAFNGVG